MSVNKYGKRITRAQAQEHFKSYIDLREKGIDRIKSSLNTNELKRFYLGRPGKDPLREDLAYVFDKNALEKILEKLNSGEANGIIIFNGVRASEGATTGSEHQTEKGRPTLMIFPYVEKVIEDQTVLSIITSSAKATRDDDDEIGAEHPGTGGSGTPPPDDPGTNTSTTATLPPATEFPEQFLPYQVNPFLDI